MSHLHEGLHVRHHLLPEVLAKRLNGVQGALLHGGGGVLMRNNHTHNGLSKIHQQGIRGRNVTTQAVPDIPTLPLHSCTIIKTMQSQTRGYIGAPAAK
eukprot:2730061-Pyramimonas_sp.AAC.1